MIMKKIKYEKSINQVQNYLKIQEETQENEFRTMVTEEI